MKKLKRTLLSTLVIASIAGLTACGGGSGSSSDGNNNGGGGDNNKGGGGDNRTPITQEFSATLPADSPNNIAGQTGFVDVIMEIPRDSLSAGEPTPKDYEEACSDLANGFNNTYKDIYKKAQVSNVYITDNTDVSTKQTLKPVLSHAIDGDNANRCVLQLGAGLVLRSQTESRKDERHGEIKKTPEAVGIEYSKGSIKLDKGEFELIGVVNYDQSINKITLSQASNVNEIFYNFYDYDNKSSKYKYNNDKSGTLSSNYPADVHGVQFKTNQPGTKEVKVKPADVSGVYFPINGNNLGKLFKDDELKLTLASNSTVVVSGKDGVNTRLAHLYGLKVSATDATWTGEVDNTYFNYSFKDNKYSIKTLEKQ